MSIKKKSLLNDIFLSAVASFPERIAMVCNNESWTYQELYQHALNYAQRIHQYGGHFSEGCVAIYGTKSLETAAAILGSLLSGYAYMPLDITLPANRLEKVLQIAKPQLLIITTLNPYLGNQLEKMQDTGIAILKMHPKEEVSFDSGHVELTDFDSERIAYLLFTSGSTGLPKGVCISHRAVVTALDMLFEHIPFQQEDQIANQSAFCYDLSVFDLFSAFKVGACVHLLPPEIMKVPKNFIEYIQTHQLTSLYMVSSALEYILKHRQTDSADLPLKRILLTGDPVSSTLITLMKNHINPECSIWNLYSAVEMPYAYTQVIDLWNKDANLKYFPLKGSKIEASVEDEGVLVIKGPILFSGYIQNGLTVHDLEQNPITQYRTGDWVVLHDEGIELFGRVDRQIKLLGNRIELDDIEINIESLEQVQEAAVVVNNESKQLHSFIVLKEEYREAKDEIIPLLKQNCLKILPAIMVPNRFFIIDAMPRTTSGKKDRKSLPKIELSLEEFVQ